MARSREHADGVQDRRNHPGRGLLAGAAGPWGMVAAETVAGAGTAQATQGQNVMLGTHNTGATHRTGIFTMGNSEWAQLADPGNTGLGPQGVHGAGHHAGIGGKAVSGTGAGGLGASSGIGACGAFSVFGIAAGRRRRRLLGLTPLVAVVGLAAALAGCGGSTSPAAGTAAPSAAGQAATAPARSGPARDACALVTAAGLRSLGVTGAGSRQEITRGTATVYGCTWGHPPGRELHLQFEPLDPAAASQVRVSLGDQGTVVPGVGDGARGQVGSVLAAVNFSKGTTFVAIELFGTGAGGRKAAFLAVARDVASRL